MKRIGRVLVAGALIAGAAGAARGHSLLLEASPAPGAALSAPPRHVSLRFNNRIEKKLSGLRVVDSRGGRRALPVSADEGAPDRLTAAVPELPAGSYRLEWQVLSTDGHVVSGSFSFRIAP